MSQPPSGNGSTSGISEAELGRLRDLLAGHACRDSDAGSDLRTLKTQHTKYRSLVNEGGNSETVAKQRGEYDRTIKGLYAKWVGEAGGTGDPDDSGVSTKAPASDDNHEANGWENATNNSEAAILPSRAPSSVATGRTGAEIEAVLSNGQ
ncbi:hypothetical protein IAT40_007530 [Kwoniella sp. CBS 6097]